MTPPSAGPSARLMLKPTALAATAAGRSSRGTRRGTIDCHAGAPSAAPVSMRNVKASSSHAVIAPCEESAAMGTANTMINASTAMR
jgi:hypothetical protein